MAGNQHLESLGKAIQLVLSYTNWMLICIHYVSKTRSEEERKGIDRGSS